MKKLILTLSVLFPIMFPSVSTAFTQDEIECKVVWPNLSCLYDEKERERLKQNSSYADYCVSQIEIYMDKVEKLIPGCTDGIQPDYTIIGLSAYVSSVGNHFEELCDLIEDNEICVRYEKRLDEFWRRHLLYRYKNKRRKLPKPNQ
jgi:hypothetical protein